MMFIFLRSPTRLTVENLSTACRLLAAWFRKSVCFATGSAVAIAARHTCDSQRTSGKPLVHHTAMNETIAITETCGFLSLVLDISA
jgi:hypothetical protein